MNNFKKIFFVSIFALIFSYASVAFAITPTLSLSVDPNNSSLVTLNVRGDANSGVVLFYYSSSASGLQARSIGTTNPSGTLSTGIVLTDYNISQNSNVYVSINGYQSAGISWPYSTVTVNTGLSFSQTSLIINAGQSNTITASNSGSSQIYLSSNTNPQAANFSINGNQITINGLTNSSGSATANNTTATFCLIGNSTSNSNCATLYVIVQNASAQPLSFSQNNTSIINGQNVQISITGGNGFYQVQNNSSSSIISTSLNGPILTLYANGTTGSTTVTVCSTDMTACGNVFASIGTYTTSGNGLSFSQSYPTVTVGQTQTINISGGFGTYYLSSNSNTNVVQTYLSTSSIALYGNTPGNSTIVVCAPSGSCGTMTVSVVSSSGGALTLSQNNFSVIIGQVTSIQITGGTLPYALYKNDGGVANYSLSGNTITISGISSGSSSATVCSSGGACILLTITVTGTSQTISGVQPVFSQNNFSMNTNQTTSVALSGNGGYYVSNNSNNNIVSVSISGNSAIIFGITVGSANVTICQTGGQCNTLYITVNNSTTSTVASTPTTFDQSSVNINVGGSSNVNIFGGSGVGYYVSYNSNTNAISVYVNGNSLVISGKASGTGTLSVCSSANVCGSISVTVNQTAQSNQIVSVTKNYIFTKPLKLGSSGTEVRKLQEKLKNEGIYTGPITGYYGNLTVSAVKKYQKLNRLSQLGSVGPGTRAVLNK